MSFLFNALIVAPPLLVAVILHEIAHGWVADKLGDPTARSLGRITLNPIRHIDPYMTLFVPAFLIMVGSPVVFGGAKPVPVNPSLLRNPRRDMVWVAIAGPAVNVLLAGASWLLFKHALGENGLPFLPVLGNVLLGYWLLYGVLINIVLAAFNMIPVPPLDGGRIAVGLLPLGIARQVAQLERFGLIIVIFLLISGVLDRILQPLIEFTVGRLLQ